MSNVHYLNQTKETHNRLIAKQTAILQVVDLSIQSLTLFSEFQDVQNLLNTLVSYKNMFEGYKKFSEDELKK